MLRFALIATLLAGCSEISEAPPPPPGYMPPIPEPPREDKAAKIREALTEVRASSGPARTVAAEALRARVEAYRGDITKAAPADLAPLSPEFFKTAIDMGRDRHDLYACVVLIRSVALCQNADMVPRLMEWLPREPNEDIQAALLDAMGLMKDARALPVMTRAIDAAGPAVRRAGAMAMARLGDPSAVAPLRRLLEDPSEPVRWASAFGLAYFLKNDSGREILRKMLDRGYLTVHLLADDPSREVTIQYTIAGAARALGALKDKGARDALRQAVRTEGSEIIKESCRDALRAIEE